MHRRDVQWCGIYILWEHPTGLSAKQLVAMDYTFHVTRAVREPNSNSEITVGDVDESYLCTLRKCCQCLCLCVGYFDKSCLCWEDVINVCVYIIGGKQIKKSGQWFQSGLWFQRDGESVMWMLSCLGCPYLSLLSLSEILPDVTTPETVQYTYDVVCIGASVWVYYCLCISCKLVPIWAYRMNFDFDFDGCRGHTPHSKQLQLTSVQWRRSRSAQTLLPDYWQVC